MIQGLHSPPKVTWQKSLKIKANHLLEGGPMGSHACLGEGRNPQP